MSISLRINKVRMVLAGLVLAAAALLPHRTEAQTNPTAQSLPYYQDFSSFTCTTTTYPAGWQGWTSTTALSTSYTTAAFTADATLSTGGASNGITSAFVADMRGKMGLLSTASNQRAICLAFSTTGLSTVTVSYVAATQSQVYGGRIDQLGLQYRVGITGAFTNLTTAATDYRNNVASAITSTGDSNATNAAFISLTLPAACNNQSVVQVRWIIKDSSGAGNRPSFSIDNISVFASSQITNYYNKAGFRLDSLGSWGTNTDGTGTVPSAFTNAGQQFNIKNSNTGISGSTWTVTGNC